MRPCPKEPCPKESIGGELPDHRTAHRVTHSGHFRTDDLCRRFAAQPNNNQHPVALDPNASSATCVKCHSGLQKGQYVHTAMAMGCTTCHTVQTENRVTRVRLTAPVDQMCVSCHALSTADKVLHGPYREGLCVACHSPHASDFPRICGHRPRTSAWAATRVHGSRSMMRNRP